MVYLNKFWIHDILYVATVPYAYLYYVGYICNIMLPFNVNIGENGMIISRESDSGTVIESKGFHMSELPKNKTPLIILVIVNI